MLWMNGTGELCFFRGDSSATGNFRCCFLEPDAFDPRRALGVTQGDGKARPIPGTSLPQAMTMVTAKLRCLWIGRFSLTSSLTRKGESRSPGLKQARLGQGPRHPDHAANSFGIRKEAGSRRHTVAATADLPGP